MEIPKRVRDRIALARAHRPAVDANGHPLGPSAKFVYDEDGRLKAIEPPADAGS